MVHIKVSKGLDIPLQGEPKGSVQQLIGGGEVTPRIASKQVALNLKNFPLRFHLLSKVDDYVKKNQPLAEDKLSPGRFFVAPAAGRITEIRRGLKRALEEIVIQIDEHEEEEAIPQLDLEDLTQQELLQIMERAGIFTKIYMRPFDILANPKKLPKSIFVKALETAPFTPPAELQVENYEESFKIGLAALSKLTNGKVHLVYSASSQYKPFITANAHLHTVEGPHPAANSSIHIQNIDPIITSNDLRWVLNVHDVTCLGHVLLTGQCRHDRIISIAGPGILEGKTGYFRVRDGTPIASLISGRLEKGDHRLISGDPLMGHQVTVQGFLGYNDFVFCAIPDPTKREFLHFFRLGLNKYSFSRAYFSGHLNNEERKYAFTTSQHGENRPFIDSTLIDKVQPLEISSMLLSKAIMAEDFETAETLGLLEVAPEDFALPTFVCPSKVNMVDIVKRGLARHAEDVLH